MSENITCFEYNCRKIPSLIIDQNSPHIKIFCPEHKNKTLKTKDYIRECEQGNIICSNCKKKAPSNFFVFFCNNCKKYFDNNCFYGSACFKKNHPYKKMKIESIDNNCQHNKYYTKYCQDCKISLCNDCFINNNTHRNHKLKDIKVKTQNEIQNIDNILKRQEEMFKKIKTIVNEYLEELEDKIKLKRIIFKNYLKNKFNGNAISNLENLNLNINQEIYKQINSFCNKDYININNNQKALSLYYFNKICGNIDNNINIPIEREGTLININNTNNNINIDINKNYLEDNNNEKTIINVHKRGKLIKSISEKNKIYSLIALKTGNIACGFSSGIIKVYETDRENYNNRIPLLTIELFKGRRINYLYQLEDSTLLCCTFSKIHHIKLRESDTKFEYLGSTKLYPYELPKKIIELGKNIIVSLGEKKKRKANTIKIKSILKIFKYNEIGEENEENIDDLVSVNSNASSGWESIFSSEGENEEDEEEDENKFIYDYDRIKIFKKNENKKKLFICTIFGTKISSSESSFQFVASSNSLYTGGENKLIFYGIMKNPDKKGDDIVYKENEEINKLACSQNVDSICFVDKNKIGVALQNYEESDFDGIAIIDVKNYKLIKIIKGFPIGILKLKIINNKKNIFFFTNKSKDIKKLDEFGIFEYSENKTDITYEENSAICSFKKGCLGCVELKSNNNRKLYYAIYTYNAIFIMEIKFG